MNWFPGRWRIPSAFGNEPPRRGLRFDELPRVRELQQRYAQSSDEEVLDAFRNARIIDSVLRFFLYTEARKRGITDKLAQEKHGEKFEFEKDEIIIFRFAETHSRDTYFILLLLFIYVIYPMQEKTGIYAALAFSVSVNTCILLAYTKVRQLSYVTNKRIVLNEEYNIFIYLYNIISYNITRCKFEMKGSFFDFLFSLSSLPYNEHIFLYKTEKSGNDTISEKTISSLPQERVGELYSFCHREIINTMIDIYHASL